MKLEAVSSSKTRGHASHPNGSLNSAIMLVIKFNQCTDGRVFKFITPLIAFRSVRCTEAAPFEDV